MVQAAVDGRLRKSFVEGPVEFLKMDDEELAEEVEGLAEIRYGDLDLSPIELDEVEPVYTIGRDYGRKLDPQKFIEREAEDFLEFWEKEIGSHDNVDLGYAEQVLLGEREGSVEEVRSRFDLQPHSVEALEASDNPVYDAVTEEMIQTLYGQAINRDEEFKDQVEAFERVLKKYDVEPYMDVVENGHSYSVEHLTDPEEMLDAATASGSCISSRNRYFEEYAEDEFSMISEVRKDGEAMGYLRNFLMEDNQGNEFLAVDTIEIDQKNFEENTDVVKAAGLSSIQMMYDLEADYVVGSDSRVRYGVRQGYSNTEKSVSGEKLGEWGVNSYSFRPAGESGKSAYMLMENPA